MLLSPKRSVVDLETRIPNGPGDPLKMINIKGGVAIEKDPEIDEIIAIGPEIEEIAATGIGIHVITRIHVTVTVMSYIIEEGLAVLAV